MIFRKQAKLMGNQFEFIFEEATQARSQQGFELAVNEIKRVEQLFTTFSEESQTNLLTDVTQRLSILDH